MFDDSPESVEYVREVLLANLRNTVADSRLSDFKSFTLEGTWARPTAVTLYADRSPPLWDEGIRIAFR